MFHIGSKYKPAIYAEDVQYCALYVPTKRSQVYLPVRAIFIRLLEPSNKDLWKTHQLLTEADQ